MAQNPIVTVTMKSGDVIKAELTDSAVKAKALRDAGEAVLVYFHEGNKEEDFSEFTFGIEDPDHLEDEYTERVYRRLTPRRPVP